MKLNFKFCQNYDKNNSNNSYATTNTTNSNHFLNTKSNTPKNTNNFFMKSGIHFTDEKCNLINEKKYIKGKLFKLINESIIVEETELQSMVNYIL